MTWEKIAGVARHLLTFAGGWLVTKGYVDAAMLDQLVGAALTIGGVVWSVAAKKTAA